jgi:hypothetical protein
MCAGYRSSMARTVSDSRARASAVAGRSGGTDGNERLTGSTGAVLIVLFAVEGLTVLSLSTLLSWHVFIGVALIPPVLLKLGSTGYRFVRYYAKSEAYVRKGSPPLPLRVSAL